MLSFDFPANEVHLSHLNIVEDTATGCGKMIKPTNSPPLHIKRLSCDALNNEALISKIFGPAFRDAGSVECLAIHLRQDPVSIVAYGKLLESVSSSTKHLELASSFHYSDLRTQSIAWDGLCLHSCTSLASLTLRIDLEPTIIFKYTWINMLPILLDAPNTIRELTFCCIVTTAIHDVEWPAAPNGLMLMDCVGPLLHTLQRIVFRFEMVHDWEKEGAEDWKKWGRDLADGLVRRYQKTCSRLPEGLVHFEVDYVLPSEDSGLRAPTEAAAPFNALRFFLV
ncbi:hypothetical protein QCA50_010800 [Cerrena zonata]|uniref:Uncharacterized protein n=1 Tax=Cerrena zonata TaxID=2478898 RepID=A0AAW0G6Q2_9APHY